MPLAFPSVYLAQQVMQLLEEIRLLVTAERHQGESIHTGISLVQGLGRRILLVDAENRTYDVPRTVLKERLEILWVSLFRLRLFTLLDFRVRAEARK